MSRVEKVESEIERMTGDELAAFRAWFTRFDAESWDLQFESDVHAGRLDELADSELRHHEYGRSSEL
jgi:hypothetical protein